MFKAVQYGKLIDKDRSQSKASGCKEHFGRNLSEPIKDAFEMLIKIFNSH